MIATKPSNVEEYIAGFPKEVQKILKQVRTTIKKAVPDAEETIKYAIPTLTLQGNLISFAAYKTHIGIYPIPGGDEAFKKEILKYKAAKSTARLPLDEPIPTTLITKLAKFRAKEHLEKLKKKKQAK